MEKEVIVRNIQKNLKKINKTQSDLAKYLDVSKQTMSKMLSGTRIINAIELYKIAEYFQIKMEDLITTDKKNEESCGIYALMGKVESEAALDALKMVDKISDMIIFHKNARDNYNEMNTPWDD